jgi:signal transduction histidine kinase
VLDKVEAGVLGLDSTVNDLLHFTAERDPHWIRVPLHQLIDDVRSSLAPQLAAQGIKVENNIPGDLETLADREMLRRAVLNIALNAIDAMPDGGQLVFTAFVSLDAVELEIADTGPGLSDEVCRRAFEPFFTTKSTGTGLGLAIVDRVAEVHGGEVLATNCPEGGAAFTIRIPRKSLEAAA